MASKNASLLETVDNLFPSQIDEGAMGKAGLTAAALLGLLAARSFGGGNAPIGDSIPSNPGGYHRTPTHQLPAGPELNPPTEKPKEAPPELEKNNYRQGITPEEAMDFIEDHEGIRYRSYRDSRGKKTIGVGFNLQAPGAKKIIQSLGLNYDSVKSGKVKLNQEQVEKLFRTKVIEAMNGAERNIPNFENLSKDIQFVVVDMIYNLGMRGFLNLSSVNKALREQNYPKMARAMAQTAWRKQVGHRAEKLINIVQGQDTIAMRESLIEVFGG